MLAGLDFERFEAVDGAKQQIDRSHLVGMTLYNLNDHAACPLMTGIMKDCAQFPSGHEGAYMSKNVAVVIGFALAVCFGCWCCICSLSMGTRLS